MKTKYSLQWQSLIALFSLIAIGAYLLMYFILPTQSNYPLILLILIGGIPMVLQIAFKLIQGNLGADLLAAIALITSVILDEYLAASLIILMMSSGQTLEFFAMRKASSVLFNLLSRMPSCAHRSNAGVIEECLLDSIQIDDQLLIYPHETCPVDGLVLDGHGMMDESYLTGEPYQISKAPGSKVLSGAINGEALLTIKATSLPSDSRFATIVKVLEEAEQKRPSIRRLGDQIGAIFTPIALAFACAAWYYSGESLRFLSVLVMATPCPLLIAIPITLISAISRAAKQGIIIKDPTVLERLITCTTAIFDKTGTLTYGKPTLTEITTAPKFQSETVLHYAASIERYSKHPLALAVLHAAEKAHLTLLDAVNVSEEPGKGLNGLINKHHIQITGRNKLLELMPQYASMLPPPSQGLECIVLIDNEYAASLHFHDAPRSDSQSFINHLGPYHQFKKIMLVSGDRESEVQYLGKLLDVSELYASQSPEQKLAIVREERLKAPTVFMGDGINDAPALTAATVGIAFGQGNSVTGEAAGAVILESTLSKVDELIHLSLYTRKIALQSALGGMILSLIGMAFAATGYISPVTGALLQEFIDVLAILNALRLTWGSAIDIDLPES